jgi:Domain of unknown function (DUF4279)
MEDLSQNRVNPMTEPRKIPNHEYSLELRFTGKNLNPPEITARLGLLPTNFFVHGMDYPTARDRLPFRGYDAQSDRSNYRGWESLEESFEFVCRKLHSKKAEIIKLSQEFEGHWWCGHFQSSFDEAPTLSPSFLAEIASYGLPIFIDNHFVSDTPECDLP